MNSRSGGGGRTIRGVAVGIVTNITDPQSWGRVKVRLPWLDGPDGAIETHWARVTGWYAGNSRGAMFIPEIGDEVLVAFEAGDPNHPYVIGAVFNGDHTVPGPGNPDGANDHKWFRSRAGHDLEFLDSDGAEKIRLVDSSTNNSVVFDTAADTITTEAKTGTINIQAPKGLIKIICVDLTMTTSEGRNLEVGTSHTVTVGSARTANVSVGNLIQTAGSSVTITTPTIATTTKAGVGVSAGAMVMNQGSLSSEVGTWSEVQQGPVTRTVGSQSVTTDAFMTVNMAGEPSGTMTILAGTMSASCKGGFLVNGQTVSIMGGMINAKGGSMVVAKDVKGGKAEITNWLGGSILLNPNALTFGATKLLDMVMGMDFHTTLPAPIPPPAGPWPPLPFFPAMFAGPILIDFKNSVLINGMPAAGAGATAISFHMPPLPWPWPPISHRPMITAAIMALAVAPFSAMLEMARGKMNALASASGNPVFQRGFVADFIGSSHVGGDAGKVKSAGKTYAVSNNDQGTFSFTRIMPMFSSGPAFIGFLASLVPLPVANASINLSSPTVSHQDQPMGMMIPLGANSCSDVPLVPNAMVVGFSNVLTGISIGDFLGQLAWGAIQGAATRRFQAGLRRGANATARRIANSDNPRLQNAAQRVNNFMGGRNCIAEGHPVDVVSGTMFIEATDFELHGAQTAMFRRFYNSKAEDLPTDRSAFGPGWRHSYDQVLIADESDGVRTLALRDDENRIIGFDLPLVDGESDFHPAFRLTLTRVDGRTYTVRDAEDFVRTFAFGGGTGKAPPPTYQPGVGKTARLVQVQTPVGGAGVRLDWQKGRLVGFTDACERAVAIQYSAEGLITGLRLKRAQGEDCDIFLAAYRYDADGRLIAHRDRNQNLRWYRYDALSRITRETDRNGYSFHFHYDDQDRCTHSYGDDNAYFVDLEYIPGCTIVGDALGGITRYKYDDDARVTDIIDAEGGVTQRTYTAEGWLETETDPNLGVTEFEYDATGARVRGVDAVGNVVGYVRDPDGRLLAMVDAGGNDWRIERDDGGRFVRTVTPMGRTESVERDADGRIVSQQLGDRNPARRQWKWGQVATDFGANGVRLDYSYDALGRLTRLVETSTDGQQREVRFGRDAEGRLQSVDGPAGRRERYDHLPEGQVVQLTQGHRTARRRYEGWGRLVEHVDPLGRSTRFEHDPHHMLTRVTLPSGGAWTYLRNRLGQIMSLRTPDGLDVRFTRDPGGRVVEEHRPDGRVSRTYDANGNVVRVDWGDGTLHRLTYDARGRLTEAEAGGHRTIKRSYNADGELVGEVQGDEALRWAYDAHGRVRRRTTTWGSREQFSYDENGLTRVVDPQGGEHEFEHDAWGRRAQWAQPDGSTRRQTFDLLDRLTGDAMALPGGDVAVDRRLTWTDDDTIASVAERDGGRRVRHQYRHDAGNRLVGWQKNDQDEHPFELDDGDNLVRDRGGTRTYEGQRLVTDGEGRRYRHDRRGRLMAVEGGEGTKRLWFDARDRLSRVHTADDRVVHHRYDALGRLSETLAEMPDGTVREEIFYWDGDALARRIVRDHAGERPLRDERYTPDPERPFQPLLRVVAGGDVEPTVQYYTADQRGAAVRLTGAQGEALWTARYDPYGRCTETGEEAGEQPLRLMGQVHDRASALSHHRFRVYDPESARFVSPDPIGLAGGANAFAYPSDPLANSDPLGLISCRLSWNDFQHETAGMFSSRADAAAAWRASRAAPADWQYHGTGNGLHHFSGANKPPLNGAPPNSVYSHNRNNVVGQNAIYDGNGSVVGHVDFKNHGIPSGHYHTFPPGQPGLGHGAGAPHYHHTTVPPGWSVLPAGTTPQVPIGT